MARYLSEPVAPAAHLPGDAGVIDPVRLPTDERTAEGGVKMVTWSETPDDDHAHWFAVQDVMPARDDAGMHVVLTEDGPLGNSAGLLMLRRLDVPMADGSVWFAQIIGQPIWRKLVPFTA